MILDAGIATILRGHNNAGNGEPVNMVYDKEVFKSYYGEKTVGIQRFRAAKSDNEQADLLIEIQHCGDIRTNMDVCQLESFNSSGISGLYKILQVQRILDSDGIPMSDLTLQRIDPIENGLWKQSKIF